MKAPLKAGAIAGFVAVGAVGAALLLWPSADPAKGAAGTAAGASSRPAAAGTAPKLTVSGAYVREPANPDVAAAYFSVRNTGGVADALTAVTASTAGKAEMHTDSGSRMAALVAPRVPAGGTLDFEPGVNHVMLMSPGPLKPGDHVTLTLTFAKSAAVTVDAPVVAIDQTAPTP
jgi:copper(I)-binding protein